MVDEADDLEIPGGFAEAFENLFVGTSDIVIDSDGLEGLLDRFHERWVGEDFGPKDLAPMSARDFLEEEENGLPGVLGCSEGFVEVTRPLDGAKLNRLPRPGLATGEHEKESAKNFHVGGSWNGEIYSDIISLRNCDPVLTFIEMKRSLLVLFGLVGSLVAAEPQLPQMSDKTEWLGYFVGWEAESADFGIGADGEVIFHPKVKGKRAGHKEVNIRYRVEEKIKDKWVSRSLLTEGGLTSEAEKGLDPKEPITIVTTVTGDTRVEWTHVFSRGKVMIMPKLLEKKTENEIRIGVHFAMPRFHKIDDDVTGRDLRDKLGSDYLSGKRIKDGKKVKLKFSDVDEEILGDDNFKEGATEIEVSSKAMTDDSFKIEMGDEKSGMIEVVAKGPLYESFQLNWWASPEKLGEKDCYVSFEMD